MQLGQRKIVTGDMGSKAQGMVSRVMSPMGRKPLTLLPSLLGVAMPRRSANADVPHTLGRFGDLEVRLARGASEVRKAQSLRYKVFYEEMSAIPNAASLMLRRDADEFDALCDHILVLDHAIMEHRPFRKSEPKVVGTYRVLRQEVADRNHGFYTANEFDIAPLLERKSNLRFLELGRSCVLKPYRTKKTIELLWHGVWTYILAHRIDAMIGCASLEGTDPSRLALPLSFLHHHARATDEWRVRAVPHRFTEMNRMAKEAVDVKAALHALPPLIKGYIRLGATVGEGAVIDHQFGTTDVCIVLPVANIAGRYIDHFGADASRFAKTEGKTEGKPAAKETVKERELEPA